MTRIQRWTLLAAVLGSAIVFVDGTIVNLALAPIGRELPATFFGVLEGQAYIVSGYFAVLAALLIIAGALADFYGRRRIFAIGLAGFGASSVLCGIAPSLEFIVLARLLQGAAGALLVPGSLSIITATFEGPARARAFGIWASATSGLTLFGLPLGGLIVETLSWRVAFLINVPLVVLALWATIRHMPETRDPEASGRFDWLGAFVGGIAIGGLAFGAIRGQQQNWQDQLAFVALGVGFVALVAFPVLMKMRPHPLVPLSLFRNRTFAVINLATFLVYGALYATFIYQALLLQGTLGYSSLGFGLSGFPGGILLTTLSPRVGGLAGRIGPRPFLVAGPILMAAGQLWWSRIPATSAPWKANLQDLGSLVPPPSFFIDVVPALLVFGIGISLVVAPLTSTLMSSIPAHNAGLGSAINNALARVGQPLLGAVFFIVVSATFYSGLAARVPSLNPSDPQVRAELPPLNPPKKPVSPDVVTADRQASVDAFHVAALMNVVLLGSGAIVTFVGLRERRPRGTEEIAVETETDRATAPGP
jgi:EmrB/QacA subfamily drug resistance transporter